MRKVTIIISLFVSFAASSQANLFLTPSASQLFDVEFDQQPHEKYLEEFKKSDKPTITIPSYNYRVKDLEAGNVGVRLGIGTDITGGIAFGGGINYLLNETAEFGIILYGGTFTETSNNGFNEYEETTRLFVFALMANYLFNYDEGDDVWFFIAGFGFASVYVEYEESSPTDTSLGAPLPGGGSSFTEEGGAGGTLFNIGGGKRINEQFDIRLEIPVIVSFASYEQASTVIPTLTISAGYRFGN